MTEGHTALRRGFGLSWWTKHFTGAYNGQTSRWYQAALQQKAGRIAAAGMTIDVAFESVAGPISNRIDDCVPSEIQRQPVPRADDRYPRPLGDDSDSAPESQHIRLVGMRAVCEIRWTFIG